MEFIGNLLGSSSGFSKRSMDSDRAILLRLVEPTGVIGRVGRVPGFTTAVLPSGMGVQP
jgi:hypothetical protein